MPSPRAKTARLLAIALAAIALFGLSTPGSMARPSKTDLSHAKDALSALDDRLSAAVEEYDAAAVKIQDLERRLGDLRTQADRAKATAAHARDLLAQRARDAYTQGADRLGILLGSSSFSEFSERWEFLNRLSGNDADLAARAQVARQRARWAGAQLADVLAEQKAEAARLAHKRSEIEGLVADQRALVHKLEAELARPLVVSPALGSPSQYPLGKLPPASPAARDAIAAAYSVIGVRYQWGGASPETGFDCSGLTMWSWAHAGVSLPHSSSAQYSALPHVARNDLQPGDLLFFYSPIHHVGMYLGNGNMIDAPHTGSYVGIRAVTWDSYVGAGRPGI